MCRTDNEKGKEKTICPRLLIFSPLGNPPNLWGISSEIEFADNKANLKSNISFHEFKKETNIFHQCKKGNKVKLK